MTKYKIRHSTEYNSTEIYFDCKPTEAERAELCWEIIRGTYDRFIDIEQDANTYYKKSESVLKPAALERLKLAEAIVNTYNHDCSNSMVDYFDRWIYDDYCVKIA